MRDALPRELAYLRQPSYEYKQTVKAKDANGRGLTLADKIARVYGSVDAYEAFKLEMGMLPEQAKRFERFNVLLQPMQLEFAVWARRCDEPGGVREIGLGGARGPGKSFAVLAQAALDDCQRFPGLKVLYLRKTGKAATEQLHDLINHVLGNFPGVTVLGNRIKFRNGSVIIIGGFKDDAQAMSYQGVEYDLLIIEEATQLSETTYKALRLSERSSKVYRGVVWRPRTYVTFNPLGIGHKFFKQRFVDPERQNRRDLDRKFIQGIVTDNAFINPEYIRNLQDLVGAVRRAYLEGDWDVSAGAYFETWRYNTHVIKPLEDVSWMSAVWGSMDYGFQHWNMTYLHAADGDGTIYTFHELAHRKQYPATVAADIHETLKLYGLQFEDLLTFTAGADVFNRTGLSQYTIEEQYRNAGVSLSPAETSPGSRIGGAQHMARLLGDPDRGLAPQWYVTERCPRLADCMPYLEVDPNNGEDVLKVNADSEGTGGDDPYDAARYGIHRPRASSMN